MTTVLRALRHGWLIVLLATVAGGAGGAASLHQQTPVHRSTVQLLVAARGATTPEDDARNRSFAITRAFGLAQVALTAPALADAQARAGTSSAAAVAVAYADLSDAFLRIDVTDPDPTTARAIAAAFGTSLPDTAAGLGLRPRPGVSLVVVAPAGAAVLAAPLAWRYLLTGLAAGLGVGLALALLREILGTAPADPEQTAAAAGWPLLATVPEDPEHAAAVTDPRSRRAEASRSVLTAAVHADRRGVRTIAVVGAGPGDGASALAADLAALATVAGHEVAVADVTTPDDDLRHLVTRGTQELLVVDAGRVLPHLLRPELLTGADTVVVVTSWRHRHRLRGAARALGRLDVSVAGLVVNRGPVDVEARALPVAGATLTVPLPRPSETPAETPSESLPTERSRSEMHA